MNKIDTKKLKLLPVPEGCKIRIRHITDPETLKLNRKRDLPPPKYVTVAWLYDGDSVMISKGSSFCSANDAPNRKLGRIIAHNRCIKAFHKAQQEQQHG